MLKRFILAVLGTVLAVLLGPAGSVAVQPSGVPPASFAYDAHGPTQAASTTTTERGPPETSDCGTAYDTVDHWSRGVTARTGAARPSTTTRYTTVPTLVQAAMGTSTAEGPHESRTGNLCAPPGASVAANGGSRIAANQAAGNAARDRLLAGYPGALPEQSFTTTAGVRRLDILTQGGLGIESKVGRTSLTATTRSQIAKDGLLLRSGDVTGIEWVFSRSGVTGQIGPTGPLADALSKAGIPWRLAP